MKTRHSLALAALLAAGAAHADTISRSASYGPEATDWDPAQVLQLQQFNPALGSLNQVTFVFSGTMRSDFDVENTGLSTQTATNTLTGSMQFTVPTVLTLVLDLSAQEMVPLAGGASYLGSLTDSAVGTKTVIGGLAPFIGTGDFAVDVLALANATVGGAGNLLGGADTFATASIRVTYDYTAAPPSVPEPASLALVGLALAATALSRRRA